MKDRIATRHLVYLLGAIACNSLAASSNNSTYFKWALIEKTFNGPDSKGRGDPNPFAIPFDVEFTGPSGKTYRVPGFYDGDGRGGLDGKVWKVRFSADELGLWSYRSRSPNAPLDGVRGEFRVDKTPESARGFWKLGRLEAMGTADNRIRYLKFRDGPYWLKAGCDDPENFLGSYQHYDTNEKRRAAIDTLAARGVNSLYVMTHNIDGDDKDVWPWLGASAASAKKNSGMNARFDIAKLETWRQIFEYMQTRGVVLYIVLEDDSAWKGYDHKRYYREIVARFGYLPALTFNLGEEHNENYRLTEALRWLEQLAAIDPYDHPRGIHNVNEPMAAYVDADVVDFTSIQTGSPGKRQGLERALEHNQMTLEWIRFCRQRKRRPLVVNFDEARPEEDRRAWWSVYLGGGVWESHVNPPYDRPMTTWNTLWTELGGARHFMESMPFWEMEPRNERVIAGRAFCLAKTGKVYAFYLPVGGTITVELPRDQAFELRWWNPANGRDGRFTAARALRGGVRQLTAPGEGDWAARITRIESKND